MAKVLICDICKRRETEMSCSEIHQFKFRLDESYCWKCKDICEDCMHEIRKKVREGGKENGSENY